ncbi:hypothetical protein [Plastoroseomonas hellenica]|uniref:hypothetical protein n=1 Tax=Plastoroseomonas hellenica TaxID=2687306 RepID=UPI001BAAA64A|nr:hypothetical protein [Plastoroseomonas hellenica]MBR0641239.1 hypothetical protein [Plastoroseomonas hellenica]
MTILVYPFQDLAGASKYRGVMVGWIYRGKADIFIWPGGPEFDVPSCLASAAASTIVILGHCTSGSPILRSETSYLQNRAVESPGETVRAGELAVLLRNLGLNDNNTRTIKCLNCSSGDHFDGFQLEASFATTLKAALAQPEIGLGNIHVYGYLGELMLLPDRLTNVPDSTGQLVNINNRVLSVFATRRKAFRGREMRFEATGDAQADRQSAMALWQRVQGQPGTIPY